MKKIGVLVLLTVLLITTSCVNTDVESTLKSELTKENATEEPNSTKGYSGYVTFWFDDGYESTYEIAYPELEKRNWDAVIAVLGNRDYASEIFYPKKIMTWEQVETLEKSGWEVSNHSMHHLHLNNYGEVDIKTFEEEIVRSAMILRNLGFNINSFTFPYGEQGSTFGQKYVSDNHSYWRSSQKGINEVPAWRHLLTQYITSKTTTEELKEWFSETETSNGWLILNLHDISTKPDSWDITKSRFLELISLVEETNLKVVIPQQMYLEFGYAEGDEAQSLEVNDPETTNITISKINVNSKVGEVFNTGGYWNFDMLDELPVWISSTPWFGYPGLSAILGHRQWGPDPKVFANLDKLESGDLIKINDLTFKVKYSLVINPEELYDLYDTLNAKYYEKGSSALLLITCTPYGTNLQRLLVIAEEVTHVSRMGSNPRSQ